MRVGGKLSRRCGCSPEACQILTTAVWESPSSLAISRELQCVACLMKCGVNNGLDCSRPGSIAEPRYEPHLRGRQAALAEAAAPFTNRLIRESKFTGYVDILHSFGG